ncbi:hypothetical protein BJX61DRAFT_521304 [Aspergillus egyptiacus]|nr:hypothetical protein BJX61DRAFT_521304 [Aspergillus egyptiacus]
MDWMELDWIRSGGSTARQPPAPTTDSNLTPPQLSSSLLSISISFSISILYIRIQSIKSMSPASFLHLSCHIIFISLFIFIFISYALPWHFFSVSSQYQPPHRFQRFCDSAVLHLRR